jgi:hypothetical protein
VLIRFGRWQDILDLELPEDQELFCSTAAVIHYARGVAFSALGRISEAESARTEFTAAVARVPDSRLNSVPAKEPTRSRSQPPPFPPRECTARTHSRTPPLTSAQQTDSSSQPLGADRQSASAFGRVFVDQVDEELLHRRSHFLKYPPGVYGSARAGSTRRPNTPMEMP